MSGITKQDTRWVASQQHQPNEPRQTQMSTKAYVEQGYSKTSDMRDAQAAAAKKVGPIKKKETSSSNGS